MKVYIVGNDNLIKEMFLKRGFEITRFFGISDIVVFTGGSDVTPKYYGMDCHLTTYNDPERDLHEKGVFDRCYQTDQLKVGICRGSQFLTVMNGGALYQDVDNHCRTHDLIYTDENGKDHIVSVTSTHHQMMYPHFYGAKSGEDFHLWGFAAETSYRNFKSSDIEEPTDPQKGPDVEILFWPHSKSLCFQGHPEYGLKSCEDLFFTCLNRALKN